MNKPQSNFVKRIYWHDPSVNNDENVLYYQKLFESGAEVERSSSVKTAFEYLKDAPGKWIVVTSGSNGPELVSQIHELSQVIGILVFCHKKAYHDEWALKYHKVAKVATKFKDIQEEIESLFNTQVMYGTFEGIEESKKEMTEVKVIKNTLEKVIYGHQQSIDFDPTNIVYHYSETEHRFQFSIVVRLLEQGKIDTQKIFDELVCLNPTAEVLMKKDWIQREKDPLKAFLYLYSTDYIFKELNQTLCHRNYHQLAFTLAMCIREAQNRPDLQVEKNKVLYRGIKKKEHEKDYCVNGETLYWPAFTSTTSNIDQAKKFSGPDGIIFKIKLSTENPHLNVKLGPYWTCYPREAEILLFPHFAMKVTQKEVQDRKIFITVEQDANNHFLSSNKEKLFAYWRRFIEQKVDPKLELVVERVSEVIKDFNLFRDFWPGFHLQELGKLQQDVLSSRPDLDKIKEAKIERFSRDLSGISPYKMEKLFDEKGYKYGIYDNGLEDKIYYPYKLMEEVFLSKYLKWVSGLEIESTFRTFFDLFIQKVNNNQEPQEVESIMKDVFDEMKNDWDDLFERLRACMRAELERLKPELLQRIQREIEKEDRRTSYSTW